MTYDAGGRVTDVANFKSDDSALSTFAYGYDNVGNRLNVAEAGGERVTWTYDATYQLLSETRSGVSGYAHTFTYDPVGNRLAKDDGTEVTTYVYDAANRLQTAEDNSGVTTYTFDANGNQRVIEEPSGDLTTSVWDYENQLVSVEDPLGDVTTYTYTAAEQRVAKETDVQNVKFLWAGQNIVQEYDESDVTQADYTLDPRPAPQPFGKLVSQHRDAATSFYHYDALGSTRNLTDDAEVETDDYAYEAFGKVAASSGTTENPFQWVGQVGYYADEETSLYSLRRRQYGNGDGRFLSEDPIGFAGGDENLQRYVFNNPIVSRDPAGLQNLNVESEQIPSLTSIAIDKKLISPQVAASAQPVAVTVAVPPIEPLTGPVRIARRDLGALQQPQVQSGQSTTTQIPDWFLSLTDEQKSQLVREFETRTADHLESLNRLDRDPTAPRPDGPQVLRQRAGSVSAHMEFIAEGDIPAERENLLTGIDPATGMPPGILWPVVLRKVPDWGLPRPQSNPLATGDWYVLVDNQPWRLYENDLENLTDSLDRSAVWGPLATALFAQPTFDEVRRTIELRARRYRNEMEQDRLGSDYGLVAEHTRLSRRLLANDTAPLLRSVENWGYVLSGLAVIKGLRTARAASAVNNASDATRLANVADDIPTVSNAALQGRRMQPLENPWIIQQSDDLLQHSILRQSRRLTDQARNAPNSSSPFVLFNKTHKGSQPIPKGLGPNGGRLQSHHGLQQEWAAMNLPGYDPKLAPTVTIETGTGFPHTTLSNLQNARRDARVAEGLGKWSSTLDDELGFIVTDFRQAGLGDDVIKQVLEQNYRMLDKLRGTYTKPAGF